MTTTARQITKALKTRADPSRAVVLQRFFRTGAGEYAEGDRFLGLTVPDVRGFARQFSGTSTAEIDALLQSPFHEARLLALVLLVQAFRDGNPPEQRRIYNLFISRMRFVNNWDLVDLSAPPIVGAWLFERSRAQLRKLARSKSLWERRIAIVATHEFIRRGDIDETFRIADILLNDPHDLIHKAVGWMLREAGKRDPGAERRFLASRHSRMPRTMLRYAIERFPERERRGYLISRNGVSRPVSEPRGTTRPSSAIPRRS